MTRVGVVIPTLDGRDLLEECLPPLLHASASAGQPVEVLVVDNGSRDGTREWLAREHPEFGVLSLPENEGFSTAVNRGIRKLDTPLVLCLNNDVAVEADFLPPLVDGLQDPSVFSLSPRITLEGDPRFDEAVTRGRMKDGALVIEQPGGPGENRSDPMPVLFGVGAAVMVRRAYFLDLGGFDPTFEPYYCEDMDLSIRAWRRGWRVLYSPASRVRHRHRATIDRLHRPQERETFKWANHELLQWRHLRGSPAAAAYLGGLVARARDAFVAGRRDLLVSFAFAFERLTELPPDWGRDVLARVSLEEALRRSNLPQSEDQRRDPTTASS